MTKKSSGTIAAIINANSCFDLQFRKDTRHERAHAPTYYRWKIQFVVTLPKGKEKELKKIQSGIGCGSIHATGGQARFSVQNITDIHTMVIPFLRVNPLNETKKKDFELWRRAVGIISDNKGKPLAAWKKSDLLSLIEIQKTATKYKSNPRQSKWIDMARAAASGTA